MATLCRFLCRSGAVYRRELRVWKTHSDATPMRDVSRHWIDSKRPRAVAQVHVVRRISPVGIVGTVFRRKHDCKNRQRWESKSSGRTNVGILRCREDGRGEQTSEEGRGGDDDGRGARGERRRSGRKRGSKRRTNMIRKHRRIEQTGTRRGLKCNLYRACVDVEMYTARYRVVFLGDGKSHTRVRYPNVNLIILRAKKYTKRQRKRHHASACVSCGR